MNADPLVREVTGRTATRVQDQAVSEALTGRLFDRLAGPDGLTEHASTFSRPEVLVAIGAGLAGARRTELEELADRFVAERAVSVVADRALEERRWSTPELWPSNSSWWPTPPVGRTSTRPWPPSGGA